MMSKMNRKPAKRAVVAAIIAGLLCSASAVAQQAAPASPSAAAATPSTAAPASPLVVQNATFAWTKLPAAFFILLAAAELSRSGRDVEPGRILAGALALAAGLLVH